MSFKQEEQAQVRLRPIDTVEAARRSQITIAFNNAHRDEEDFKPVRDEWLVHLRFPFRIEVSSDGGETWAWLLTKGGVEIKSDGNSFGCNVTPTLPIYPGISGDIIADAIEDLDPRVEAWVAVHEGELPNV